jgi:hypothetical protein
MGTAVDTAADKMVRLSTTWQNFKASVGELIAPAASGFLEGLTNMLNIGETMGPSLNKLGLGAGLSSPSDLVKPQSKTSPIAQQAVEVEKVVVSLESMRQAIKDLEAEYNTTQVGTARFIELRNAIEQANYQLGRASGEIYPGTTAKAIELADKGLARINHELTFTDRVLRSSVIPAYEEMALMIKGAKTQLQLNAETMEKAALVGAQFGHILTSAFTASMNTGEDFFSAMRRALIEYTKQIAIALAVTTALAAVFAAVTGKSFETVFKGVAKGTGLGAFFGEGGLFDMNATVKGADLKLGTGRSTVNYGRSGG